MSEKTILIVEDNKQFVDMLSTLFTKEGYAVARADNAISAVREARRVKPDLVILDIGLPGGDGFVVMERLRSLMPTAAVPIVIVTALGTREHEDRAHQRGVAAFLGKPVDNDELLRNVRTALGELRRRSPEEQPVPVTDTGLRGKKILVVDDNIDFLKVVGMVFKSSGYLVVHATDAISAVAMAIKERPDVILLDLALPGGDGFVVMDRLRSRPETRDIPIIILTAFGSGDHEQRAHQAGAAAFLTKPVDNDELLNVVRKGLG